MTIKTTLCVLGLAIGVSGCAGAALLAEGEGLALGAGEVLEGSSLILGRTAAAESVTASAEAASATRLGRLVAEATGDGARPAFGLLEEDGALRLTNGPIRGRVDLASGQIFSTEQAGAVGVIHDGFLYAVDNGAIALRPLARLQGFISARAIAFRPLEGGGLGSEMRMLRGPVSFRVLAAVQDYGGAFYRVRLVDGDVGLVPAWLVGLVAIGIVPSRDCPEQGEGLAITLGGETLPFRSCRKDGATFRLTSDDGDVVMDSSEVQELLDEPVAVQLAGGARLQDGSQVFGRVLRDDAEATALQTSQGLIVIDRTAQG